MTMEGTSDMRFSRLRTSSDAILILQTPSSNCDDRVSALRFIQFYLNEEKSLSTLNRRRINQLAMDNVMQIIMNEDRTADTRKRQIIRTECFLMLSNLLASDTLFGTIRTQSSTLDECYPSVTSSSYTNGTETEHYQKTITSEPGDDGAITAYRSIHNTVQQDNPLPYSSHPSKYILDNTRIKVQDPTDLSKQYSKDVEEDDDDFSTSSHGSGAVLGHHNNSPSQHRRTSRIKTLKKMYQNFKSGGTDEIASSDTDVRTYIKSIELNLLKPVILQGPHEIVRRQKILRERSSFFTGGKYRKDNYALGVDPSNFQLQVYTNTNPNSNSNLLTSYYS